MRAELEQTARELRAQTRKIAKLEPDWEKMSPEMRAWYFMLARRVEGLEEKMQ